MITINKYRCGKCNRDFKRNEHLIRHINKKNDCCKNIPIIPNNSVNIPNSSETNTTSNDNDNEDENKCEHCKKPDLPFFIEVRVFNSYWDGQEQCEYYGGEYWCLECVMKEAAK